VEFKTTFLRVLDVQFESKQGGVKKNSGNVEMVFRAMED